MNTAGIFGWLRSLFVLALAGVAADVGAQDAAPAALVRLEVQPDKVALQGPRARVQLVVTGFDAAGNPRDVTHAATIASSNEAVAMIARGAVLPKGDGTASIAVTMENQRVEVPVEVTAFATPEPISFRYGALAALSKQGCNSGACHGSPSGKGGFRLSLRAFDPPLDAGTLIREEFGRRVNPLAPEASLLLLKPMMKIPHGGGMQLHAADPAYRVLRDWIGEGCKADPPTAPLCVKVEVFPPAGRVLKAPAWTQQIRVVAHFADGKSRDVTDLAVYSSSDSEVATIDAAGLITGQQRGEAAILVRFQEFIETTSATFVRDIPGFAWVDLPRKNFIDEAVDAKLKQLQYLPSDVCSDEEFLRRVHLDVIGLLPTVEQTQQFLANPAADKRATLIDQLLDRPEFARFWALKWGDLLRLTSDKVGGDGVHKYHRWVERAWATNMPYDQFARELLTATGSTLTNPPANFFRTAGDAFDSVETVSQVFLGARLQCAKCHNHPFERWSQDNYYGMAAFFHRVQRKKTPRGDEQVIWISQGGEVTQPRTQRQMKPWLPQAGELTSANEDDRRTTFADWLIQKDNPFFARVEANRIWSQLIGRGIVEPIDDFRDSNPPSNAALLNALARDFADSGFDRKRLIRTILNSRTYQASFRTNDFNRDDAKYFSHREPRLLSAEQLLDAVCDVTGVAEPFANLPPGTRATQLPAPDLAKSDFLKIFGQPERQTVCACERSSDSNLNMALQFFNGPLIHGKLRADNNRLRKLVAANASNEDIIRELYLSAVCRPPTDPEVQASLAHLQANADRLAALEDIGWALLNTNEFLFQH